MPDGQWLGFFADNKLKKVSVSGGPVMALGDALSPHGGSWNSQGVIAFSPSTASPLRQVSEAGGPAQPLTRLDKGDVIHSWPDFLPGGQAVLFARSPSSFVWEGGQLSVQSVATGKQVTLVQAGMQPRYASPGRLVYEQGGNLMAVPFDPQRLAITGQAVPVLESVLHSTTSGAVQYSLSRTGSLVYVTGGSREEQRKLVWVNRNGTGRPVAAPVRAYLFPRLSPDGRQVAVGIAGEGAQLWLDDLARETLTPFTFQGNVNLNAVWTPDGKWIAFRSTREIEGNICWQRADGSGGFERLLGSDTPNVPISWSPDGQFLAFLRVSPTTGLDIWILRMSDRKAQPFLETQFNESAPQFSPNGRWISYISNESGHFEVYVQPYPGPGGKWRVSTEGGTEPTWNSNGREIFYRTGDKMMAVDVDLVTQPGRFAAGKPHVLFQGPYLLSPGTSPNYDVSRDGQRFLMLKSVDTGENAPTQINVVLNWFEELKQRVPSGTK